MTPEEPSNLCSLPDLYPLLGLPQVLQQPREHLHNGLHAGVGRVRAGYDRHHLGCDRHVLAVSAHPSSGEGGGSDGRNGHALRRHSLGGGRNIEREPVTDHRVVSAHHGGLKPEGTVKAPSTDARAVVDGSRGGY